ncbi:MAG TPA: PPOX class F420-dependent oxidoreductase [Ktedonobacterales bacterium]|jgi:PPOX class probable F420-dependent enzyme|nr:PPOX class F420-dependent oxidoreductase [Ktedonobacterales bacterium]
MTTDSSIHPFTQLDGEQFIVLTTYRKTGEAVPTTVWFAERDGKLYISTGAAAGKLKRIRTNPRVTVAPSDHIGAVKGAAVAAVAREATPDEHALAEAELAAKYGAQLGEVRRMRRPAHETSTHLVVVPAE